MDLLDMTPEQRRAYWARMRADATKFERERKPKDPVDAMCHEASVNSAIWAEQDGLYPTFDEWNEPRYKVQQGLRAAHVGREDAAATLILMRPVLRHLRAAIGMLWFVVLLLALILWRVW